MSKQLYSLRSYALAVLVGVMSFSCSEDDEVSPDPESKVEYNSTSYTLKSGLLRDHGIFELEPSHYNYDFMVTDGTILIEDNETTVTGAKIVIFAELLSPGANAFQTGTFTYIPNEYWAPEHRGKFVFNSADLVVDTNNDNIIDDEDDSFLVVGGTIKASGGNNNYTLEYDLILENGKTLKGVYSGDFTYLDNRD